jgi:gamma-glutamylcyclotransferase (GGCT)/AIG2-like uncharacterized protein YtfP
MLNNIFVYGTLMYREVWGKVVKGDYINCAATINGYERFAIKNEVYPAVIKYPNTQVEGIIWKGVNSADLDSLNAFEGEYYSLERGKAIDHDGQVISVLFYLLKDQYQSILESNKWDKHQFEFNHLDLFINTYFGFNSI